MPTYKTQGIILRRKNFFEADRLLTIYTRDYGKIKAIAKGSRRTLSKLGGHLELFYLVDLILAEGKNLDIITAAETINSFSSLRLDKDLINRAYYISELVDSSTKEEAESPDILILLIEVLSNINKDDKLLRYFELKLFSILGYAPELDYCISCKDKLQYNHYGFSYSRGGLVCGNCVNFKIKKISPETIKFIRLIIKKNFSFIKRIKINQKILSELEMCTQEMIDHIIEKEVKSKRFIC